MAEANDGDGAEGPDDGFVASTLAELRKVVYPTQEQLVTYYFVVMVFVLVMMAIIASLDLGLGRLAFAVFGGNSE